MVVICVYISQFLNFREEIGCLEVMVPYTVKCESIFVIGSEADDILLDAEAN